MGIVVCAMDLEVIESHFKITSTLRSQFDKTKSPIVNRQIKFRKTIIHNWIAEFNSIKVLLLYTIKHVKYKTSVIYQR